VDWARAIEINKQALTGVVEGLLALLAAFAGVQRLPRAVYHLVARDLFKAESAVRRLIVLAARGMRMPLLLHRPMPAGLVIAGRQHRQRMMFQLYDTRVNYSFEEEVPAITGPRIRTVDALSPRAQFLALFKRPPDHLASETETRRLRLRLAATEHALQNIAREARRLLRWKARRAAMQEAKFTSPCDPARRPDGTSNRAMTST
jgi:hypothetical protein